MTTEPHRGAAVALLLAALPVAAAPLQAGTITLEIRAECRPAASGGLCRLEISNRGDAPATEVQARLDLDTASYFSERRALLAAAESWETTVELGGLPLAAGRHAVPIEVHYADQEGYPFAALAHGHLDVGELPSPTLNGALDGLELTRGPAEARWRLHNSGRETLDARIRLLLPRTLQGDTVERPVRLAPGEVTEGTFSLENFSAFPGSAYRIYALVEADGYALFLPATAEVLQPAAPTDALRLPLALTAGLLAGIWLAGEWSARRGGPNGRRPALRPEGA